MTKKVTLNFYDKTDNSLENKSILLQWKSLNGLTLIQRETD
jgi:hypothetical protein